MHMSQLWHPLSVTVYNLSILVLAIGQTVLITIRSNNEHALANVQQRVRIACCIYVQNNKLHITQYQYSRFPRSASQKHSLQSASKRRTVRTYTHTRFQHQQRRSIANNSDETLCIIHSTVNGRPGSAAVLRNQRRLRRLAAAHNNLLVIYLHSK